MFAATHMAVGALVAYRVQKRVPSALIALGSAAALDMTIFWHARDAEYQWPRGSFSLFQVVPYPHDIESWLLVALLVVSAAAVAVAAAPVLVGNAVGAFSRHYGLADIEAVDWRVSHPCAFQESDNALGFRRGDDPGARCGAGAVPEWWKAGCSPGPSPVIVRSAST